MCSCVQYCLIIDVPRIKNDWKQSPSLRFSLSKFRLIQVRTVCFDRDAKSSSPFPFDPQNGWSLAVFISFQALFNGILAPFLTTRCVSSS